MLLKNVSFSLEQLKDIYLKHESGISVMELARQYNVTQKSMRQRICYINMAYAGKPAPKLYKRLVKEMNKDLDGVSDKAEDIFDEIKQAQINYNRAVAEFIEKRVSQEVNKIRQENKRLEQELGECKRVIEEAKDMNWVDALKKRWS